MAHSGWMKVVAWRRDHDGTPGRVVSRNIAPTTTTTTTKKSIFSHLLSNPAEFQSSTGPVSKAGGCRISIIRATHRESCRQPTAPEEQLVFTHHDLAPRNLVLESGTGRLWLVDWDLAGFCPPYPTLSTRPCTTSYRRPSGPGSRAPAMEVVCVDRDRLLLRAAADGDAERGAPQDASLSGLPPLQHQGRRIAVCQAGG